MFYKGDIKMKRVELISYEYPDLVKVLIGSCVYVYRSSEVMCRRFVNGLNYGSGFHSLSWFKGQAELVEREEIKKL